jgi:hypothetical protein
MAKWHARAEAMDALEARRDLSPFVAPPAAGGRHFLARARPPFEPLRCAAERSPRGPQKNESASLSRRRSGFSKQSNRRRLGVRGHRWTCDNNKKRDMDRARKVHSSCSPPPRARAVPAWLSFSPAHRRRRRLARSLSARDLGIRQDYVEEHFSRVGKTCCLVTHGSWDLAVQVLLGKFRADVVHKETMS